MSIQITQERVTRRELGAEPFRVFFPAGLLGGVAGVLLWPLHFAGWVGHYPGPGHARLMACGLFGAFIVGFLGTALPRMLGVKPLALWQTFGLLAVHSAMVACLLIDRLLWGDCLFLALWLGFGLCLAVKVPSRQDLPPPGFVLVLAALASAVVGTVLAILQHRDELPLFWISLQHLLSYQGFVLLPIMGVGPFLLPRFFGRRSEHDFPESLRPSPAWIRKASLAAGVGLAVLISFVWEANGGVRGAYALRFAVTALYLFLEIPFRRAPDSSSVLSAALRLACGGILAGFLTVAFLPQYRVALLHLTLVGGFAVTTFVVAIRVVFGHSGNLAMLQQRNRWLWVVLSLMLLGMATRISGDFLPRIMASHYSYGALLWVAGVGLWAFYVLPKIFLRDPAD